MNFVIIFLFKNHIKFGIFLILTSRNKEYYMTRIKEPKPGNTEVPNYNVSSTLNLIVFNGLWK